MASPNSSPKVSPRASSSNAPIVEEMDTSLTAWLTNTHVVLKWPGTILTVAILLVAGAFAEIAPRKSLEIFNNTFGSLLFFIFPLVCTYVLDWPTGLLAAVVCLIVFARLQNPDMSEGFSDNVDDGKEQNTKLVSNPHRWFVERMLGEKPVAISSERIITSAVQGNDMHTSISPSSTTPTTLQSIQSSSSSNK
jgi:predicted membrane protein